jgi:hypothetical protein
MAEGAAVNSNGSHAYIVFVGRTNQGAGILLLDTDARSVNRSHVDGDVTLDCASRARTRLLVCIGKPGG